jgi:hypothetical protein
MTTEWTSGDDEDRDEGSLADSDADLVEEQGGLEADGGEEADSLADTEAEITLVQKDRHGEDS